MQYACVVINQMIRWVRNAARMGEGERKMQTRFLWENPKKPLAKPKSRGNIKMDLQEI
jgi:hypothetical protein